MNYTQYLKYPDLKPTFSDTQSVFREKNVNWNTFSELSLFSDTSTITEQQTIIFLPFTRTIDHNRKHENGSTTLAQHYI